MIEKPMKISLEKRIDDFALLMHECFANQNREAEDAGFPDIG